MYRNYLKEPLSRLTALAGLILLSPVLLLVMTVLFAGTGGNPFFTQVRPGKDGKLFRIIKFKTMTDRKGADGQWLPDQLRITPLGRLIRRTSVDELLQLINVIRGDMSMIGPRPLLPEYLDLYNDFQKRRHEVKPGITGWAQVNGRNAIGWEEKFVLDVWYADHISASLDLKIFLMSVKKVFLQQGISEENHSTVTKFKGNQC